MIVPLHGGARLAEHVLAHDTGASHGLFEHTPPPQGSLRSLLSFTMFQMFRSIGLPGSQIEIQFWI